MSTAAPPRLRRAVLRDDERVRPLELFFDLVFVLTLTQCTALMAEHPTWQGLVQGVLIAGIMWWGWVGYSWLGSVVDPEEGLVRLGFFAAMAGLLIVALCIPQAYGVRGAAVRRRLRDRPLRAAVPAAEWPRAATRASAARCAG